MGAAAERTSVEESAAGEIATRVVKIVAYRPAALKEYWSPFLVDAAWEGAVV